MVKPEKIGTYRVQVFNGERNSPFEDIASWDGENWSFPDKINIGNTHWHPNLLVEEALELILSIDDGAEN